MDGSNPNISLMESGYSQPARGYPQQRPYGQQGPYPQQPAYRQQAPYSQQGQQGYQHPYVQPAQQGQQPAYPQQAQSVQQGQQAQPTQPSRGYPQQNGYISQRQQAPAGSPGNSNAVMGSNVGGNVAGNVVNPVMGGYKPQRRIMPDPEALAAAFAKNGYAGYLVVHREYTSTRFDPVMTIKNKSIAFNNTCIRKLDDVVYIQLLVNTIENKLVVRPCAEGAKDSIRWCVAKDDTRKTREITCPDFTEKLYKLLSWDDVLRYRLQGTRITYQGEQIYIFDLSAHEAWSPTTVVNGKRKAGKRILPEEWADSFGTPVEEHDDFTNIDLSKGYLNADALPPASEEKEEQLSIEEVKV